MSFSLQLNPTKMEYIVFLDAKIISVREEIFIASASLEILEFMVKNPVK